MATTYCTVGDVADFLRIPITATTTPNTAQVEKIIKRKEDEPLIVKLCNGAREDPARNEPSPSAADVSTSLIRLVPS